MRNWILRLLGRSEPRTNGAHQEVTLQELRERAERIARQAGFAGTAEALRALDSGELDGTLLETELRSIRFLDRDRELASL